MFILAKKVEKFFLRSLAIDIIYQLQNGFLPYKEGKMLCSTFRKVALRTETAASSSMRRLMSTEGASNAEAGQTSGIKSFFDSVKDQSGGLIVGGLISYFLTGQYQTTQKTITNGEGLVRLDTDVIALKDNVRENLANLKEEIVKSDNRFIARMDKTDDKIDDVKHELNLKIDDTKRELNLKIDDTKRELDEKMNLRFDRLENMIKEQPKKGLFW
jgi:hypothetical protein